MLSQHWSFILAPSIFLVACSDSISHYVCPSVGPSVTHLLFSLFDHAWGPQSHCLGQSSCFWSHWSQFQMNSLRNFKKSKNFQKFKIQKSEVLGQRMCSKCLSMLSQHWSFILAPSVFLVACSDSISHYVCPSVGPSVSVLEAVDFRAASASASASTKP